MSFEEGLEVQSNQVASAIPAEDWVDAGEDEEVP